MKLLRRLTITSVLVLALLGAGASAMPYGDGPFWSGWPTCCPEN